MLSISTFSRAKLDEGLSEEIALQLEEQNFTAWESCYETLPEEIRSLWGNGSLNELLLRYVSGENKIDYEHTLKAFLRLILDTLKTAAAPIGMLLAIALISGIVDVLIDDEHKELKRITLFMCFGMYVMIMAYIIASLADTARGAINGLSEFCEGVTPVLTALLAAIGSVASSGMVRPLTVFLGQTVAAFFRDIVVPFTLSGAVIAIAGSFTAKGRLTQLYLLIRSSLKWLIGMVFTIFLGIVSIQGISAAGADSIGMRTLKYTLDKGIPIVGGAVSGTFDTARSCAVLVKNAAGITGILLGIGCILMPLIKIGATVFALKLASAACSPVADERMSKMIADVADICGYLIAAVATVGLMFVIMLGLFIATGRMAI